MRIFINYRRDDSAGIAGRLYDALSVRFGSQSAFIDVDAIPPGEDFISFLERTVASATVMLVVIGPMWLASTSGDGRRRLDNPGDFVRAELHYSARFNGPSRTGGRALRIPHQRQQYPS